MFQTNFPALNQHMHGFPLGVECTIFMPPSMKRGHIGLLMSVGRYVGRSVRRLTKWFPIMILKTINDDKTSIDFGFTRSKGKVTRVTFVT